MVNTDKTVYLALFCNLMLMSGVSPACRPSSRVVGDDIWPSNAVICNRSSPHLLPSIIGSENGRDMETRFSTTALRVSLTLWGDGMMSTRMYAYGGREGAIRSHGTHASAAPARLSRFERHSLSAPTPLPSHHSLPSPWLPPCLRLRTVYPPQMLSPPTTKPMTSSKMMLQEGM
jgi:hypothetical protein